MSSHCQVSGVKCKAIGAAGTGHDEWSFSVSPKRWYAQESTVFRLGTGITSVVMLGLWFPFTLTLMDMPHHLILCLSTWFKKSKKNLTMFMGLVMVTLMCHLFFFCFNLFHPFSIKRDCQETKEVVLVSARVFLCTIASTSRPLGHTKRLRSSPKWWDVSCFALKDM